MKNKLVLKLLLSVVSTVLCLFFLAVSAELYLASKHKELLAKGGDDAKLASRLGELHNDYPMTKNFSGHIRDEAGLLAPFKVTTNSWGIRGPEVSTKKTRNRILVLGDSMVFSYGVSDEHTFPVYLGKELNEFEPDGFEVLNFGVSGYNTYDEWQLYEALGMKADPDVVVIMVVANDHEYMKEIAESSPALDNIRKALARGEGYHLVKWFHYTLLKIEYMKYYKTLKDSDNILDRVLDPLSRLVGHTKEHGIELVVILVPNGSEKNGELGRGDYNLIAESVEKEGITYIDLDESRFLYNYEKPGQANIFLKDGHFNPKGNQELANLVAKYIIELMFRDKDR